MRLGGACLLYIFLYSVRPEEDDKSRAVEPFSSTPVNTVVCNEDDKGDECVPKSKLSPMELVKVEVGYDAKYLASTIEEATSNFWDLTADTNTVEAERYECDDECQFETDIIKSLFRSKGNLNERSSFPAIHPPSFRNFMDWWRWKETKKWAEENGLEWVSVAQYLGISNPVHAARASLQNNLLHRTQRDVSSPRLHFNTFIEGVTHLINCSQALRAHERLQGFLHLCGSCRAIRKLPGHFFPAFVNEAVCLPNARCLISTRESYGACRQQLIRQPVLKNLGTQTNPVWVKYSVPVRVGCVCALKDLSDVFKFPANQFMKRLRNDWMPL